MKQSYITKYFNAFSKIDFRALPNKDVFLICDNLISDRNQIN